MKSFLTNQLFAGCALTVDSLELLCFSGACLGMEVLSIRNQMQCLGIPSSETKGKKECLSKTLCLLIGISKQCSWVFFSCCHVALYTSVCCTILCHTFSIHSPYISPPLEKMYFSSFLSIKVRAASENSFHINTLYPSIKGLWGISSIFMVQVDASF